MGLDCYLTGSRYFCSNDETREKVAKLFPELEGMTANFGDNSCVNSVIIDVGYWRKANAIHQWFVKNVQDGEDDCSEYYVSREQLAELRGLCQRVLEDNTTAELLLPTQGGFFFGSTAYDEGYFDDIKRTIEIIDKALSLPESWDFDYHASW